MVGGHSEIGLVDKSLHFSVVELSVTKFPNFMGRSFFCVFYSLFQVPKKGAIKDEVTDGDVCDEHFFKVILPYHIYDLGDQKLNITKI